MMRSIYVAATSQHVGKTTTTLGLVAAFMKKGFKVGYCKPVGQKFLDFQNLRVDKDALLFADLIHFQLDPEIHSPIILGKGATSEYLDDPRPELLRQKILKADEELKSHCDLVIYEGTGHPGVGSIADVSNAEVASLVNAGVIMVVEGGIGSTIDMLNMSLALFREHKVPILGVILNKVWMDKKERVTNYVRKKLDQMGLELLGSIPYDKILGYPLMRSVNEAIRGTVTHHEDQLDNKVEDILAGSLVDLKELKSSQDLLLVVSARLINRAVKKIRHFSKVLKLTQSPLAGIVATGHGEIEGETLDYINRYRIPLIRTHLDTYGCVIKISNIEVKINRNTPWKIERAIQLIEENVDLERIMEKIYQPTTA